MQKRTRTVLFALSITVLIVLFTFFYLADDDHPTPEWLTRVEWMLMSKETKGQGYGLHGGVYLDHGDYDLAIAEFNKSLEYYPLNGATHYDLGLALYKKGRVPEACAQWQEMENPDEEFVSYDVETRLMSQSRAMLKKCHQSPRKSNSPSSASAVYFLR